jgi:hypothetical protein
MKRRFLRLADLTNLAFTWATVLLVTLLVCEALWLRATLGHWPVVYRDPVDGVLGNVLDASTSWLLVTLFFGFPLWAVSIVALLCTIDRKEAATRFFTFGLCAVLILGAWQFNPMGFPEWWLD